MKKITKINGEIVSLSRDSVEKIVKDNINRYITVEYPEIDNHYIEIYSEDDFGDPETVLEIDRTKPVNKWTYEITYRWIQTPKCRYYDDEATIKYHTKKLLQIFAEDKRI
jgi:hypothetical protein